MTIARDPTFQDRVKYWLFNAAIAVVAEVNTTPSHAARVTYAQKVFAETADVFAAAICVLNNATVATEANVATTAQSGYAVPDSDGQFATNSFFNALAGVAT